MGALHRQAKEIFLEACGLSPGARAPCLDRLCGDHPDLRREVEELLAFHDQPGEETTAARLAALETAGERGSPLPLPQIPDYRVLRLIGEGGMGAVYEAEQVQPVRRRVAIKLLKRGLDTEQIVRRFEAERQALAMMDHPNIARVFDAGASRAGLPFFAMEYVEGTPITEHCDQDRLEIASRLRLFTSVCDAVQHAHQKGVIHRDLKPSNVLVRRADGEPVVKVIDFGIAKAVHARLSGEPVFTEAGQLLGTPRYMSPEQAEGSLDVDTRSDVYSLGVLLYELLTGGLPLGSEEDLRSPGRLALRRTLREDPTRPSQRVRFQTSTADDVAGRRRLETLSLSRRLRGDLDWIVMKALDTDRARRYASVTELATDLRRHLLHEPVSAGPPSRRYRLAKFMMRHRVGVVAGLLVGVALVLGVIGTGVGLLRASSEREAARREAEKAAAISDFLESMLSSPDPSAEGREVRVVDVLDRAALEVEEKFGDQPEVEAAVRQTLGRTLVGLGMYDEARLQLQTGLQRLRSLLGEDHPETLSLAGDVAATDYYRGRVREALALEQRSLELRRRVLGPDHEDTLTSLANLGIYLSDLGRLEEAETVQRELVERSLSVLGEEHRVTLTALNNLALTLKERGQLADAEQIYRRSLRIRDRVVGDDHPRALYTQSNLAFLLDAQGKHAEALELHRETLEAKRRVLGEDHPETFNSLNGIGLALLHQGSLQEAEKVFRDLLERGHAMLANERPEAWIWRGHYGACLTAMNRYEEAESHLLAAHRGLVQLLGDPAVPTRGVVEDLIELYRSWGRTEDESRWLERLGPPLETVSP